MDIIERFKNECTDQLVKYAVSKQLFCPYSKKALDHRNCIMIEVSKDGTHVKTTIIHGSYVDKVDVIKKQLAAKGMLAEITVSIKK